MLLLYTYRTKPYITPDERRAMTESLAQHGTPSGTQAHYVFVDGSGGVLIAEGEDPADGYRSVQHYLEWLDFEARAVMTVDEAVPHLLESLTEHDETPGVADIDQV